MSLTVKEQLELEHTLENELYLLSPWDSIGTVEAIDPRDLYIDALLDSIEVCVEYKVACDLFNGATCTVAPQLFEECALRAEFINCNADGNFPSGTPEPNYESLKRLGYFMKARGIPLGFGFDGDGDRMMPIDSSGAMVSPDRVLASYAAYEVEKKQGGIVVTHVGASMNIDEMVREAGGRVERTPVGDAFITEAMADHEAIFGGEPVGAWIHPDIHMCPDGLLAALKLIEALQETEMALEEFINQAPVYPLQRSKLGCSNKMKTNVLEYISGNYQDSFNNVKSISKIDGVRLELEEGWILIRPSGTEPLIRVTAEAKTPEQTAELTERGVGLIKKALSEVK
jgi:phosphoglucosamine mutase